MGKSENPNYHIPIPAENDASSAHQNPHIFICHDAIQIAPADDNIGYGNPYRTAQNRTSVDNDHDIFEFFDLKSAALDLHTAQPVLCEPQVTSATIPVTLSSKDSNRVLQLFDERINHWPRNARVNIFGRPSLAQSTSTSPPPLSHWPIEHLIIQDLPCSEASPITVSNNGDAMQQLNNNKRALEEDIPGVSCFDSGTISNFTKRRKKPTDEQRDGARRVRAKGACLRCYVQKLKCSEGRPCQMCQALFNKAYGSKMVQWTACVSSHLPDLNVFALGVSFNDKGCTPTTSRVEPLMKLDVSMAMSLYTLISDPTYYSYLRPDFDSLYTQVLQYTYGRRASEVHPFILEDRNLLNMLIQLNVIPLGSPIIGHKLIGYVQYVQKLRAVCGVLAFECLGKALDRSALAASTSNRQIALIIQVALLLDQVVQMKGKLPAAIVCFSQSTMYENMQGHLVQYMSHYLQKFISSVFGKGCGILTDLKNSNYADYLGDAFWKKLSDLIPSLPLQKPPKLRKYTDMSWSMYDAGVEQIYRTLFSSRHPITCN